MSTGSHRSSKAGHFTNDAFEQKLKMKNLYIMKSPHYVITF